MGALNMRQGEECEQLRRAIFARQPVYHVIPFKERSHLPEKEFGGAFYQ